MISVRITHYSVYFKAYLLLMKILKIDSSARVSASSSRELSELLAQRLHALNNDNEIINRDLSHDLSFITEEMINHFYTPEDALTSEQKAVLAVSDKMTQELIDSDVIIIGAPMYNFTISGLLKTYIDQICRLGKTFATNDKGFEGLLTNKKVYIIATSGGTPFGSRGDFMLPYLRHALAFIGLTDITEFTLDQLDSDERAAAMTDLKNEIASLELA